MSTRLDNLAASLDEIRGLVEEGLAELTGKITELEASLSQVDELPPEADAALSALRDSATRLADVITNPAPTEEPATP